MRKCVCDFGSLHHIKHSGYVSGKIEQIGEIPIRETIPIVTLEELLKEGLITEKEKEKIQGRQKERKSNGQKNDWEIEKS